ncbi:DegQ family serine endoprotease [Geomonas propionica]|uniref:Probable periplasmic serine endoprotease DegP-like n=1 Tax=Geomonas propionica TaxID=2798582 RepID=A0ABS0YVQ7_9BACT|nr:DegQ family serine endoprotease [Geomonas propionica]MBJ6802047.1 DegQ family serine endoprotease [Geomonas propionica]
MQAAIVARFLVFSLFLSSVFSTVAGATTLTPDFAKLAKRLKPAVVNISTSKTIAMKKRQHPGGDPFQEYFDKFFEAPRQQPHKQQSMGSGFIISDDGYIITNNHVVKDADDIKVKLSDGREFKGEVKGRDDKLDLALVKIDAKAHLPVAPLGDSDKMEVGDWVMAIGNPFGLSQTVTAGIISAQGRVIGSGPYDDFIQTDASINPGNSGGPLFNTDGEVIGINTAIVAGGQGIGFAIPVNMAKEILPQLKESGKVTRGWLGVSVQMVTQDLAKSFGMESEQGALVAEVMKDSPAEKAGVKGGDIILEYDGHVIKDMAELPRRVAATPVGKHVKLVVLRDGKQVPLQVAIEKLKDGGEDEDGTVTGDRLGLKVTDLTPERAQQMRLQGEKGVLVTDVQADSVAEKAGIVEGDLIREINGVRISSAKDYSKVVGAVKKGGYLKMLLRRGDTSLFVALRLD